MIGAAAGARGDTAAASADAAGQEPAVDAIPAPGHPREKSYMKRKWGVDIQFVRRTAAGHMLEFRYNVVDPEKAAPLFSRKTKPLLTHQRTGLTMGVLTPAKTGPLRNSDPPLADHAYWMFFANPGGTVRPGDLVDLRIGQFLVTGIIVADE